jgi:hypothetical protein
LRSSGESGHRDRLPPERNIEHHIEEELCKSCSINWIGTYIVEAVHGKENIQGQIKIRNIEGENIYQHEDFSQKENKQQNFSSLRGRGIIGPITNS